MHIPRMGMIMALMVFVLGFILFFVYRSGIAIATTPFQANPSGIGFVPPAQAKSGILSEQTGEVLHMTRSADEFTEATPGGKIVQGESIATKDGTAIISIDGKEIVSLKPHSELVFVSMLEQSMMFQQKSGTIRFTPINTAPISVRAKHALVTVFGETEVRMDAETTHIFVVSGEAGVGIIDTENTTNTVRVAAGERVRIDDPEGTITRL